MAYRYYYCTIQGFGRREEMRSGASALEKPHAHAELDLGQGRKHLDRCANAVWSSGNPPSSMPLRPEGERGPRASLAEASLDVIP